MTETADLCFEPATELAKMIRLGALSPVDLVDAVLDRAAAIQGPLNPFITICGDQARAAARAAAQAVADGVPLGPLHGVPFTVKDLIATAGVRTTFGSHIHADNVPRADAVAVARLKAAGAILIGKTTTPEFGHKSLTESPLFGVTRNPWNPDHSAGGSSGGAAVAVATGAGPLAVATDGGGSTRIPAACCGVVGVKQTLGLVPHDQTPYGFANLSYIGPIARTVADAALMLELMAGPHPSDPHSLGRTPPGLTAAVQDQSNLDGMRIAWRADLGNDEIDRETRTTFDDALAVFGNLGAELIAFDEPFEPTEPIWLPLTYGNWADRFGGFLKQWGDRMDPSLVESIERGRAYTAADVFAAFAARTRLFRTVQGWFDRVDLLLTPTLARPAVPVTQGAFEPVIINDRPAGSLRGAWFPYTHPFNLTGHPAITLPNSRVSAGLPVALQIVGPWLGEAAVFRAAARFEAARPWRDDRPPITA